MALLLDTNVLLFGLRAPNVIPHAIRDMISDDNIACIVSVVSLYEIGLKSAIGKLMLPPGLDILTILRSSNIGLLDITARHAVLAASLPLVNRDPWDRLIVAQCLTDGHRLVSADTRIAELGIDPLW